MAVRMPSLRLADWLVSCLRLLAINFFKSNHHTRPPTSSSSDHNHNNMPSTMAVPAVVERYPPVSKFMSISSYVITTSDDDGDEVIRKGSSLVCDIDGGLIANDRGSNYFFFPYFMLVAFEGGSIVRASLLLLAYPVIIVVISRYNYSLGLKIMVFITFCGLREKEARRAARAVLPKFFMEKLDVDGAYQVVASVERKVVVTKVPRIMVEEFLKEYLGVEEVVGAELEMVGEYFTGFVGEGGWVVKRKAAAEVFGETMPDICLGTGTSLKDLELMSLCKEAYVVNSPRDNDEYLNTCSSAKINNNSLLFNMPRKLKIKQPKPIVFHDGRLAFFPTPTATLTMFLWLPFGIPLAILRCITSVSIPFGPISRITAQLLGIQLRLNKNKACDCDHDHLTTNNTGSTGVLYVCNHRTLIDPIALCVTRGSGNVTAVTYSLSKLSEILSPIKTVRLTRKKEEDEIAMRRLLSEGNLLICPEGTTCREPYLLRFSPLFAELTDAIVPVAVKVSVSMFYGTTASGLKWLDQFFFLMNPSPAYNIEFLERLPKEMTCAGGGKTRLEVANYVQQQLASALGFQCTTLTRKDKYMVLAGNDGTVPSPASRRKTKK